MPLSSNDPTRLSFSEREDWADVTPIPQSDAGHVLVPILYNQDYKEAMEYFRGIVKMAEYSPRVLELTEFIIRLNPAHYTIWQYRYQTLLRTKAPLDVELALLDILAEKHLKNYQVWHHRRLLQLQIRKPKTELDFIAKSLQVDTKNYHTWAYRQWVLAEFNDDVLWEGELAFVENLLNEDVRNNSAWHHRFFVVWETGVRAGEEDREAVLRRELGYTKDKISIAPNNASPWNYLRGFLKKTQTPFSTLEQFILPYTTPRSATDHTSPQLSETDALDLENPLPSKEAQLPVPLAIEFLADIHIEKASAGGSDQEQLISQAIELFGSLAVNHDTIRKRYWEYRQKEARESVTSAASKTGTAEAG